MLRVAVNISVHEIFVRLALLFLLEKQKPLSDNITVYDRKPENYR